MNRAYLAALVITVLIVGWMASGQIGRTDDAATAPQAAAQASAEERSSPTMRVRVRESTATPVQRELVLNGRTAPARRVDLRAEVTGRIVDLPVERGAALEAGQIIARLDRRDREAWLAQAHADLAKAQTDFEAARKLRQRDFMAETELAEKAASLAEATAAVARADLDLRHTEIAAPFAGVLDKRPVEIGTLLEVGDTIGTLLEQDPLLAVADVAEADGAGLRPGLPGEAELVSGERVAGRLRYVASEADTATRTFLIELEVDNPGNRLPAGVSATLRLPLEPVEAHRLSSALLALDDTGTIGIKAVDEAGIVRFHAARIVRSSADHVWLAGLPERLQVITVGQGFVTAGQRVTPVSEEGASVAQAASGARAR